MVHFKFLNYKLMKSITALKRAEKGIRTLDKKAT